MSTHLTKAETMCVTASTLRVRALPTTESEILDRLHRGDEVEVEEYVSNDAWAKIEYEDEHAYVYAEYLKEPEEYDDQTEGITYLGNWHITAYAATGNPCANGNYPSVGYTIACNSLDFGTEVYIDGVGYRTVEDRGPGWLGSEWCDLYLGDYGSCVAWGSQYRDVYLVGE